MPQRLLDLAGKQLAIAAEVPLQGVAVDHDPVLVAFGCDPVAEVLAVGVALMAEIGDDDRHPLQHPLELLREGVDRIRDEGFEGIGLRLIHCPHVNQQPIGSMQMNRKVRAVGSLFAVVAIATAGVGWSGCGGSSDAESSTNQAKQEIEEAVKEAKEKAQKGVEEGGEKAQKGAEEAKEAIKKGAEGAKGTVEKGKSKQLEQTGKEIEETIENGAGLTKKQLEEAKKKAEEQLP